MFRRRYTVIALAFLAVALARLLFGNGLLA